jgi:hypothetical protein
VTLDRTYSDAEVFDALLNVLRELGLDWVAEEVSENAREGVLSVHDDRAGDRRSTHDSDVPERDRSQSIAAVRTALEPRDRVQLAIEAIRHVVIETDAMEVEIRAELGRPVIVIDDDRDARSIELVGDRPLGRDKFERLHRLLVELQASS